MQTINRRKNLETALSFQINDHVGIKYPLKSFKCSVLQINENFVLCSPNLIKIIVKQASVKQGDWSGDYSSSSMYVYIKTGVT